MNVKELLLLSHKAKTFQIYIKAKHFENQTGKKDLQVENKFKKLHKLKDNFQRM